MRTNGTAVRANKELIREINTLRTQLKKLSASMENEAESGMSRALNAVESKSKEAIDQAIGAAQDFIDQYADGARDALNDVSRRGGELRDSAADSLIDMVKTRPFATVATIAGIGFLAGCLLRRN
jgi:ElaB/YqjD/DUF883 family membrane-anchored ribosome-binding protein